jgi:hypothetical protein
MALRSTMNIAMRRASIVETTPYAIDVSAERVNAIPDLRPVVSPFLRVAYTPPVVADVRVLNRSAIERLGSERKPLIWALQTIHNFLCDPFIRGVGGSNKTLESAVVEWLSKQLRVQHLALIAVANIANAMVEWRCRHPLIDLFTQMIEGTYTFSEVCFIATAYAFSCGLTEPSLIDLLQRMDLDPLEYTVKIHIKLAHGLISKSLSPDLSAEFLAPRVKAEDPMLDYFQFLGDVGRFFGTRHMTIYHQAKNLVALCGSSDHTIIGYELFQDVMVLLGNEKNLKEDWKVLMQNPEVHGSVVKFPDMLGVCAERREVLFELVSLPSLQNSALVLRKLSPQVKELHRELVSRYARMVMQTIAKWPSVSMRVAEIRCDLRQALLSVEIERSLWFCCLLMNKIDKLIMQQKGSIPFSTSASPEAISQISEYIDRRESVAMALLDT